MAPWVNLFKNNANAFFSTVEDNLAKKAPKIFQLYQRIKTGNA